MRVALATAEGIPATDQDDGALLAALARRGVDAEVAVWNAPGIDWGAYDQVVVRSTWDYTADRDAFVAWAAHVGEVGRLWNPPDVIRWNTHKGYLIELEERGVPTVPTAWLGRGDRISLADLARSRRWPAVVVKPAIGASAEGLHVVTDDPGHGQGALDALLAAGDAMVQPYLDGIADHGEVSVVVIDGHVSHAVRKTPASGEVRTQIEFGASYEQVDLDDETAALAAWVVEATGHDLLYARVDLLPAGDGTWQLSELEATEPALYLDRVPGAADAMAAAIIARGRA